MQVLAVGVHQQNRTEDAGARRRFDDSDERVQSHFERAVADRELQHLVVRVAERFTSLVLGDILALQENAGRLITGRRQRLEYQLDEYLFRRSVGPRDIQPKALSHEYLARSSDSIQDLVDTLFGEFGQSLR